MPDPPKVIPAPTGDARGERGAVIRFTKAGRPYYASNKASRRRAQQALRIRKALQKERVAVAHAAYERNRAVRHAAPPRHTVHNNTTVRLAHDALSFVPEPIGGGPVIIPSAVPAAAVPAPAMARPRLYVTGP
jgi:hypothetical protein